MSLCPCQSPQMQAIRAFNLRGGAVGGAAYTPSSLEEQVKAAEKELVAANGEVYNRRHALSLAVKSSEGSREDLDALDGMFVAWRDARAIAQGAAAIRDNFIAAMKAQEAKSNG